MQDHNIEGCVDLDYSYLLRQVETSEANEATTTDGFVHNNTGRIAVNSNFKSCLSCTNNHE